MILEGLPPNFAPVVSIVESKFELVDIEEVEALVLAPELRYDKFKKRMLNDSVLINLTHASKENSDSSPSQVHLAAKSPTDAPQG